MKRSFPARVAPNGRAAKAAFVVLALGSFGALLLALSVGAAPIPLGHVMRALRMGLSGDAAWETIVVTRVRLPRALVAYMVGGSLALCGGVLQAIFQNPLADPQVLGVSSGAALGATLAIYSGLAARSTTALPVSACTGALVVTLSLFALAMRRGRLSVGSLLLAGVALANLAMAGTMLVISLSVAHYDVGRQVMAWLLGGLDGRTWAQVSMGAAPILAALAVVFASARSLDALLLGDLGAEAVGVSAHTVRLRLVLASAVLIGISVAIGGAIGFVGLIAPHVLRRWVGAGHTRLLPACFLGGGAFLVLADVVARTAIAPSELNLGVVTASVGAPFFLGLLLRRKPAELA